MGCYTKGTTLKGYILNVNNVNIVNNNQVE